MREARHPPMPMKLAELWIMADMAVWKLAFSAQLSGKGHKKIPLAFTLAMQTMLAQSKSRSVWLSSAPPFPSHLGSHSCLHSGLQRMKSNYCMNFHKHHYHQNLWSLQHKEEA